MNFEKFYEKSRRANANMSLDEFIEKLKEANGSFVSDLHSKFIYRTKDDILKPYQVELIMLFIHISCDSSNSSTFSRSISSFKDNNHSFILFF